MPPATQEKKMTLNLKQVNTAPPAPKPQPKPQPVVTPPMPKSVVSPPVVPEPVIEKKPEPKPEAPPVKEKILDVSTKRFAQKSPEDNNVSKPKKKEKKKIVKKEAKKKKVVKKKTKPKKAKKAKRAQRSKDPLANFLRGSTKSFKYTKSPQRRQSSSGSYGDRMIHTLYGPEFNTFSPTQKKFIRNNLGTIHRITQNTLTRNGYPSVAVRTQQQGTNVVSFYLHPDGDISGLRLKTPIGYASLDQNTLDVIRIAYKDYPLPNKKTKIVFYVSYRLY